LKGWDSLLRAFIQLKESEGTKECSEAQKLIIKSCKLVLAGPDPEFVKDDPEGKKVLEDLKKLYFSLPPKLQEDVAIINLPMEDVSLNALIVNAIQRVSSFVVQNSLKEGFGLTVAEAMWKSVPVVVSGYCPGLTAQIRDNIEGRVVLGPDTEYDATKYQNELVKILGELIIDQNLCKKLGMNAQTRIREVFLTHLSIVKWISVIAKVCGSSEH
jgi:trehalose synthase